jgi:hypothetical protein
MKYTTVQINEHTIYVLAAVTYNNSFFVVHIWNAETTKLLHSIKLNELSPIPNTLRIQHLHFIEQKSTGVKSIIVVSETYASPNTTSNVQQYNIDGKCMRKAHPRYIGSMQSHGQIGVLLFNDGQIQIIDWLTFEIIFTIKNQQLKWNANKHLNYFLSIRDLYHLLPINEHQFDCSSQPCIASLTYAVIVCGYGNQLFIYHVRLNEYKLINTVDLDKNTKVTSIDIFRGD